MVAAWAYNPAADGQSERTNAIVETMFRCLAVGRYESHLSDVQRNLKMLPANATGISPFEILHVAKSQPILDSPGANSAWLVPNYA